MMIVNVLENGLSLISKDKNSLVANEIIKMLANQITSLKKLSCYHSHYYKHNFNISFPYFPGARDLSELCCSSDLPSDFFNQLSQICHNLQSISIDFRSIVNSSVKDLISSQNNLKDLNLSAFDDGSWTDIIPAITKHSHTITKLKFRNASPDDLESFFICWERRTPKKLLSFTIIGNIEYQLHCGYNSLETLKVIEKYENLE
ncbi:hypothetical protein GLOIN_2v1876960 [Rhizophagus irregularis DAOM 181602=DAOM 197198]|nr:hypothetical protein GLOIN_2v1876960 [Rhizophagus irregularis DAOM 181602=DAOM 197198]GBC18444.2 hypothetical protein GLOIN_2v1876960 [Rhizophagus irregularis DAOM 181602=DAOM 197198]